MNISIFDVFGRKMPIHAPKIGVFGEFDPHFRHLETIVHSSYSPLRESVSFETLSVKIW